MKIEFSKKTLLRDLEEINKAIDPANVFLPLRCFYFELQEDRMIIIGSNSNLSIKKEILSSNEKEIKIEGIGKVLFPSSLFLNLIKKCENKITIEINSNLAIIKNDENIFEMNIQEANEYPLIDFNLYGKKITLNPSKLREAIKNVSFAAAINESEVIFNGVNICLDKNKLTFNATDSYRLASEFIEIEDSREISFNVSVYAKYLKDIVVSYAEKMVDLYVNDFKINLVFENLIVQSKIIDSPYKNLEGVFPNSFSKKLIVDKKLFLDAVNKAVFVSSDSLNKLRFEISKQEIKIISSKDEVGRSEVIFKQFDFEGDSLIITLSYKYLKDALSVFEGPITLNFNNSIDKVVITGESNPNNKQLIAPQRTY
ncbi:MAG: DNA polymerase III subunit beta [Metamycoplasmataceae bacterium]